MSNKKDQRLEKKIISLLQQNTGASILDSGGAYGRHWERNKKLPSTVEYWDKTDVVSPTGFRYGELWATISLYHHLKNSLIWDDEVEYVNNLWDEWDKARPDETYDKTMKSFYEEVLRLADLKEYEDENWNPWCFRGENYSYYTYNGENSLSQDFVYIIMGEWCFIEIHNGCDARGGFTRPVLFKFNEDNLFNYIDFTIGCENYDEHHYWDNQGGRYWYTETDVKLEELEVLKYEDMEPEQQDEFDKTGFVMGNPEIHFAQEGQQILEGFDVRLSKPAELPKLVIKDDVGYCPICGSKLYVDKYYSQRKSRGIHQYS